MRTLAAIAFVVGAGCTHVPSIVAPTNSYDCVDSAIVPHGNELEVRGRSASLAESSLAYVERRDRDGTHFTTRAAPGAFATEYVIPDDPYEDAVARVVDAHDRERFVRSDTCMAHHGYSDALVHYIRGESFEQIASELSIGDRDLARERVHTAMRMLQQRYHHSR